MKVAYKTFASVPSEMNVLKIPDMVVSDYVEINDFEQQNYESLGFTVVSEADYLVYKTQVSDPYFNSFRYIQNISSQINDGIDRAIIFGNKLINDYGIKNVLRSYTTEQIKDVSIRLSSIRDLLTSGATTAARFEILNLETSENITEEDRSEFLAKIDAYLGSI